MVRAYERGGAAALSILTEERHFGGSLDDLLAAREASDLPILRKDFIVDAYQVVEARAAGADAVLLIAEVLGERELPTLVQRVQALGMQALVELYDRANLPRVLDCGTPLIGINNRDLRSFTTRLEHTLELAGSVPGAYCLVSESGIRTRADLSRLQAAGVKAVLIGETLMRSADPAEALRLLRGM